MLINLLSRRNFLNTFIIVLLLLLVIHFKLDSWTFTLQSVVFVLLFILIFFSFNIASFMNFPLGEEALPLYFIIFNSFMIFSTEQTVISIISSLLITYGLYFFLNKFHNFKKLSIIFFFNIGLFFATIGFIYPPMLTFLIFLMVIALFFSQPFKRIITIIAAYLTVIYFGFVIEMLAWHKPFTQILARLTDIQLTNLSKAYLPVWTLLTLLFVISFFYFLVIKNTLTLKMRKLFWIIIFFTFTALLSNLFISEQPQFALIYPISLLTGYFFYNFKAKNYIKNTLLLAIFILDLLLGFNLI